MNGVTPFLFLLELILLGSVIAMHLSKKSSIVVLLYIFQSLAVVFLLLGSGSGELSFSLLAVSAVTFGVKAVFAPYFFQKLIEKHQLKFTASTYLNTPLTLMVLALLMAGISAYFSAPLQRIFSENTDALLLAISALVSSLFLIINRKGALSQMVGVLSLENSVVSFAILAGLEQAAPLQLAILFDIAIWIGIAGVFAGMVYRSFGTIDAVAAMQHLKEE